MYTTVLCTTLLSLQPTLAPQPPAAARNDAITTIKHIVLNVEDQQQALRFFTQRLGLGLVESIDLGDGKRWIELALPASPTRLVLAPANDDATTGPRIVFTSADVEATYRRLVERGVEFDVELERTGWGGMNAVLRGPEGMRFALASRDWPEESIEAAVWQAMLTSPEGEANPFELRVERLAGGVAMTLTAGGYEAKLTGIELRPRRLRFLWHPGPTIECHLYRIEDGSWTGPCVDVGDGDTKTLTLRPQ